MTVRRTASAVIALLIGYAAWLSLEGSATAGAERAVGQITLSEICRGIESGQPPVFVDVREPQEYAEEHLPGAISMPIREMAERAPQELPAEGVIVPYCLKDFRGFEGARRLTELGFEDVRLMQKLGINGWKAAGFPTVGAIPGRTNAEVQGELTLLCRRQS
jgi:rhodanese-related sulfurtransferase